MSTKVLLDTDIGSDIDDAVCLAYLLANPDCELMGITTVSGEAVKRARMASVLCKVAGQEIPIFPGVETPLLVSQRQTEAHQASALGNWEHDRDFPEGQAISFMRDTIRSHPGEIVLLTIGPLTNVALLFAMDPEIPSLLKSLVSMCGIYTNRIPGVGPREWNAKLDPHATAIVYQRAVNCHRSIGLDVTCQVIMESQEVKRRFDSPMLAPVLDFAQVWFERASHIIFHDPLAGTTIFDDSICGYEKGEVQIELTSEKLGGMTYWQSEKKLPERSKARHEVALTVDPNRFFDHYFSYFS
ncbi:MAG: nucleoside hydrolase [Proteobacteria bacterium]|nr:nucleoside hydrolase [Pseudomonadota bacterium]